MRLSVVPLRIVSDSEGVLLVRRGSLEAISDAVHGGANFVVAKRGYFQLTSVGIGRADEFSEPPIVVVDVGPWKGKKGFQPGNEFVRVRQIFFDFTPVVYTHIHSR